MAIERQVGWNRQLRLTALPGPGYLAAGGTLSAGPRPGGGFAVRATVPAVDTTAVRVTG